MPMLLGQRFFLASFCLYLFWLPVALWAAPASRDAVVIQQDGGSWTIVQHGDEFLHWMAERDSGVPVAFNKTSQKWEVFQLGANLQLNTTGQALALGFNFSIYSAPSFPSQDMKVLKSQKFSRVQKDKLGVTAVGSLRQLVILAYFSDHASGNTVATSQVAGDETLYKERMNGSSSSVASTFSQLSRGKLNVQSDVTPWLALPSTESSYGLDNATTTDVGSENLILDALKAFSLSSNTGISSNTSYDWVTVIHSGSDQARVSGNTLGSDRLWSRSGKFSTATNIFGGNIQISHYVIAAALGGVNFVKAGDLGVLCHEIGHLLGLPDLHEYIDAGFSVGSWDLMGLGAWGFSGLGNDVGSAPTAFGAWSKLQLGWEKASTLDSSGNAYALRPVHSTGEIYKFPTEKTLEYYLMEFRDGPTESFAGMNSVWSGALIWHIDESGWLATHASNIIHPLAKIEEADGNDSLGRSTLTSEATDLWTSSANLSSWTSKARASGSSLAYGSAYYDRSSSGNSTGFSASNFSISNGSLTFDLSAPRTTLRIIDFGAGTLGWLPIEGATGYDLQRKNGLQGAWEAVTNLGNVLTSNTGIVDNYYRVRDSRFSDDLHWSAEMSFSLKVSSAYFDPHEGTLALTWNLPIKLLGEGALNLSGIDILKADGNVLFPLIPLLSGSSNTFSYPALKTTDSINASYPSSTTLRSTVIISLSDAQRYEWIVRSNTANDNLLLSINARIATAEFPSGNIQNIAQNFTLGNSLRVGSNSDLTSPSITKVNYLNDSRELQISFNEPLGMTTISPANLRVSGANGWSTDLMGANVTVHGNLLTLILSESRHTRVAAIQHQNNNNLIFNLPSSQVRDFSQGAAIATDYANVIEVSDAILPFVQSFVLNNHDETRLLTITFSEPIFFPIPTLPTAAQFGFRLCNADGTLYAAGGNILGSNLEKITLIRGESDNFGGNVFQATTGVKIALSEEEVNSIDQFYGLFAYPATLVYGRLSVDGAYSDISRFLASTLVVDRNKITTSSQYTPRRRARFIHPHYDPSITQNVATQESLIWKWMHRLTYEINGGWDGSEKLRIEWDNPAFLSGNGLIAQNISVSSNLRVQSLVWDTTREIDARGYQLLIKRQDGLILYDRSPSLVEIDNTSPQVAISYISNSTPSYKVNAEVIVDQSLYTLPLTPEEKNKANVIIVATYTEPVIDAPVLSLNQRGSVDPVITMRSASGNMVSMGSGKTDSVFFFAYDVRTQDVSNYTDGIASVAINSVPDRSVGHIAAGNAILSTDVRIEGNRALQPLARNTFSIDTIPPTIASLDFDVEDISIVGVNSVLRMYYSENMYRLAGGTDETPLVHGQPITGVLNPAAYKLSQTSGASLQVASVSGNGLGPYFLHLIGIVESGVVHLDLDQRGLVDFHGNYMAEPSTANVVWPGPLHNRNEVLVAPGGRTRLLLSGGFPPYRVEIDPYFSKIAKIDVDGYSILGLSPGYYTAKVTEFRSQQRYVNAQVFDPSINPSLVNAEIKGVFQAFRDELDFKMVAFPFNLKNWDGASLFELLKNGAGSHQVDYSLFTFNALLNYEPIVSNSTAVGPGYGFWMAFRKNKQLHLVAEGPLPNQVVGIDLHSGWNLIGNPFDEVLQKDDIFISTGGSRYSVKDLAQSETEHELWNIDIFSPSYRSVQQLEPFQGAWLYVNNPKGTELIFFRGEESRDYPIDYLPLPQTKPHQDPSQAPSLAPPPPPGSFSGGAASVSTSSASSASGGGGGGCLLR